MIEMMGTDFVISRTERNRFYENKHQRDLSKYTSRLKNIDDMNELCELMNLAKKLIVRRSRDLGSFSDNQGLIKKLNNPNYKVKTLDEIYAKQRPLLVKTIEKIPKKEKQEIISINGLFKDKKDFEQTIKEQDWMPVQQLLLIDETGQKDSEHAKASIDYKDAEDP